MLVEALSKGDERTESIVDGRNPAPLGMYKTW